MKKIIVSLAIIVMATAAVNAQQKDSSFHSRHQHSFKHQHHGMMAKQLNLSDQQKEQMKTLNDDFHKKLTEFKKNESMTVKDYKAGIRALRTEHRTQFESILTPQQKDQVAKMKADRIGMAKTNAAARVEKMKTRLGLTDAQANQLKDLRTGMAVKIRAIHADTSLNHEQKHEQVKSLVKGQKEQLKTILTPDQLKQLQDMRGQHHRKEFAR